MRACGLEFRVVRLEGAELKQDLRSCQHNIFNGSAGFLTATVAVSPGGGAAAGECFFSLSYPLATVFALVDAHVVAAVVILAVVVVNDGYD